MKRHEMASFFIYYYRYVIRPVFPLLIEVGNDGRFLMTIEIFLTEFFDSFGVEQHRMSFKPGN